MILKIKIPESILVPIASVSFTDEHSTPKNDLIFNKTIGGFNASVKIKQRVYRNEVDLDIEVVNIHNEELGIDSDCQQLMASRWIEMIYQIDRNKWAIDSAIVNALREDQTLN
jgi:hypothetical protein